MSRIRRVVLLAATLVIGSGIGLVTVQPAFASGQLCDVVHSSTPGFTNTDQGVSSYGTPYTPPTLVNYANVEMFKVSKYTQLKRLSSSVLGFISTGHSYLAMNTNGDLALYQDENNIANGCYAWHTNTGGHPGAYMRFQPDGNLVVYSSTNVALWATHTCCNSAIDTFAVQGDGNLVLYDWASKAVYWSSHTNVT